MVGWSRLQETERHINFHPYSFLFHRGNTLWSFYFLTFELLSVCYFFNVWEHFWFSLFLTINISNIEKDFRLFCQKIVFIFQKHRFYDLKAKLLCNSLIMSRYKIENKKRVTNWLLLKFPELPWFAVVSNNSCYWCKDK